MGETCIPYNPKRVIIISPIILGNALVLGIKPIGSTSQLQDEEKLTATYLNNKTYLGNQVEKIKHIGRANPLNLEKILLLKPDLILAWKYARASYSFLSQISPTVIAPYPGSQTWREHFNFLAEALGKKEAAQQAWNHYYQQIEKIKLALGNRYKNKTISVIGFSRTGLIYTHVKNSFPGSILDDIGLQRPKSQNIIVPGGVINSISEERLGEIDCDILFIEISDKRNRESLEKLLQKPLWKSIKAVREERVYPVQYTTWIGSNLVAADAVIDDLYKYLINTP
ncbi:MAG: iron-siderophore ABC transporter substrate-binding protein [Desmonostoc geniculatum HA4340-LM1]|nr:iron-siderophore ABC transporter substrate-binding protein [Goleter apudmare HA4340-LM2]MBW4678305.1 iron-siderophore ABC transporter substrate-binding protein [Desmonostoc geniculatum HA4340-LM1]